MAFRAGIVAMLGKPNVGKSTVLNALVGQKVSIVSSKPQTTRRRVLGIVQGKDYQIAFIDTPGIHEPHTTLGRAMVEAARQSVAGVDAILYVADVSKKPDDFDRQICSSWGIGGAGKNSRDPRAVTQAPLILALNKMDLLAPEFVSENVDAYTRLFATDQYMLTTATKGYNLQKLLALIVDKVPEGEPQYPEDEYTDQPVRFMAAEIIRERVLLQTRQEVPHATAVVVREWAEEGGLVRIEADIVVEKEGQKAILIGKQGRFLKDIGTSSRLELQGLLEKPVFLQLYVKVRQDWRMNPRMLQELEYTE